MPYISHITSVHQLNYNVYGPFYRIGRFWNSSQIFTNIITLFGNMLIITHLHIPRKENKLLGP